MDLSEYLTQIEHVEGNSLIQDYGIYNDYLFWLDADVEDILEKVSAFDEFIWKKCHSFQGNPYAIFNYRLGGTEILVAGIPQDVGKSEKITWLEDTYNHNYRTKIQMSVAMDGSKHPDGAQIAFRDMTLYLGRELVLANDIPTALPSGVGWKYISDDFKVEQRYPLIPVYSPKQ